MVSARYNIMMGQVEQRAAHARQQARIRHQKATRKPPEWRGMHWKTQMVLARKLGFEGEAVADARQYLELYDWNNWAPTDT